MNIFEKLMIERILERMAQYDEQNKEDRAKRGDVPDNNVRALAPDLGDVH